MKESQENKIKLAIIGTGGHCRSIIDIVESDNAYKIIGLIHIGDVKNFEKNIEINGYPVIGHIDDLNKIEEHFDCCIIAVGDNAKREINLDKAENQIKDLKFATCIHRSASVSHKSKIGSGTVIMSGAVINGWVEVGSHCIINSNSTVEHDNKIGDFVTIAPGVTTGGTVTIGNHSVISIGSTIIHNINIGDDSVIGAHSLVNKNIKSNVVAYGVPAKIIRKRIKGDLYL